MRYLFSLLLATSFLAYLAAAQVAPTPKAAFATRVQVLGASGALFPASAVCHYGIQVAFAPTLSQAKEAEQALTTTRLAPIDPHAYVWHGKQPDPAYTSIPTHLPAYRQQFYGFYNEQNHPCLFINAFIPKEWILSSQRWLSETVWGNDGGTFFWQAIYDLTTHRLTYFSYNGMG